MVFSALVFIHLSKGIMVLSKSELISSLQKEIRVLLHLATKIDSSMLDYRPTPKQRSTIELLRYLSMMGPALVRAAKAGKFDEGAWTAAEKEASSRTLDRAVEAIREHSETYAELLSDVSEADFRAEIELFGEKTTRGSAFVNLVLCSCAAYRTQLFLYLKASGREELNSMNLWSGVDPPPST